VLRVDRGGRGAASDRWLLAVYPRVRYLVRADALRVIAVAFSVASRVLVLAASAPMFGYVDYKFRFAPILTLIGLEHGTWEALHEWEQPNVLQVDGNPSGEESVSAIVLFQMLCFIFFFCHPIIDVQILNLDTQYYLLHILLQAVVNREYSDETYKCFEV